MKDQLGRAYNRTTHLEERKRMMQTWADYLDGLKAGEKDGQMELVPFCFHDPKTYKPYSDVRRPFARALKLAGIRDFHFDDLRHAYASLAVMSGKIDIATLSQLLGQKGLKMTMEYAHFAPDYLTKAAHEMDGVLNISTDTKVAQSPVISMVTI